MASAEREAGDGKLRSTLHRNCSPVVEGLRLSKSCVAVIHFLPFRSIYFQAILQSQACERFAAASLPLMSRMLSENARFQSENVCLMLHECQSHSDKLSF